MSDARALFEPREIVLAVLAAAIAQGSVVAIFAAPSPKALLADVSDENARPIAIAITPVALLKAGSVTPARLPKAWERARPLAHAAAARPPEHTKDELARPSTEADAAAPTPRKAGLASALEDAASPPTSTTASAPASPEATGSGAPVATTSGAPNGTPDGTEIDPLKARAADLYRAQLAGWFASRFAIRGKLPFELLKTLSAVATVTTSDERRVTGFSITRPSGNATFDDVVRTTLSAVQTSGVELPAPPPLYPDMLGRTLPVSFRCTNRSQCE